ncbi:hypothetical protein JR316_0007214 [Psilocybe cubensis]|uniref:Uncharacterized protein n=1 Tax=Psilocybe cubensis TaxID=181762 RepID=A0ACB8GYS4_PSICU|nr:hypothetical protein JR316_0007214 [Psilocybe cubensis]KAH9480614.1 hypothetical protein JR316_0007214 [Psilocybe cubensis]
MSNIASNLMSGSKNDRGTKSSGEQGDSGVTDKLKNLAAPESHAAGMMGMGGMGGPGGAAASSALGSNVPSMPSRSGGMSNMESPNAYAFNRDSSHSGFGGHNPASDNYGRDTTNSETYGKSSANMGGTHDYSMSNDRDQVRRNLNQGSGMNASAGMDFSDLGRAGGTLTGSDSLHQIVDADSRLRTDSTRTGLNSGAGIHAHQYNESLSGIPAMAGASLATGHMKDLKDEHHLHGQSGTGNMEAHCSKCHPGHYYVQDSSSNTASMPSLKGHERTEMSGGSMGKYETSSYTGMGGSTGQERMNMGDSMGKFGPSTTSSGIGGSRTQGEGLSSSYGTSGNSLDNRYQSAEGMKYQHPSKGPVGSDISAQQMQGGRPSMTDKILGGAEKITGKMTGNTDMANEGEMRAAGNLSGVSRN